MLKNEATQKLCPMKLQAYSQAPFDSGYLNCDADRCMAWEEYTDMVVDAAGKRVPGGERVPRNPPEGGCSMIPPELYCNAG